MRYTKSKLSFLFFLIFQGLFFDTFGQIKVFIKDIDGKALDGAVAFIREDPSLTFISDKEGKIPIPVQKSEVIFTMVGYESLTIGSNELKNNYVVILYHNPRMIVLKELIVSSKKVITIDELIKGLNSNFKSNYFGKNINLVAKGKHIAEFQEESKRNNGINIDGSFVLRIDSFGQKDIGHEALINIYPKSYKKLDPYPYTIPFYSPIFLSYQLNFSDVRNIDFIKNTSRYEYEIFDREDNYLIKFSPKENDKWTWSGFFILLKSTFWIEEINTSLVFNSKNTHKVLSTKKNSKDPSSNMYYKKLDIAMVFEKTEKYGVFFTKLECDSEIIHKVKDRTTAPYIFVKTDLSFKPATKEYSFNKNNSIGTFMHYLFYQNL